MAIVDKILALTRQLYPRGRAFKMPFGGYFESLHKALSISEAQAYNDAVSILNNILPDNDDFSAEDSAAWERRLGMIVQDEYVLLADRKAAILRKMAFPGNIPARQSYRFLEHELRAAGFDVYVFENIPAQNPLTVTSGVGGVLVQHGDFQQHDVLCRVVT